MSLEQALAENTAALKSLTAALGAKPVAAAPATTTGGSGATAGTKPAAGKPAAPKAPPADAAPTYDDVRKRVIALSSAKGREAAMAVLTTLGVANAKDLTEDQFPGAVEALDAAINGEGGLA